MSRVREYLGKAAENKLYLYLERDCDSDDEALHREWEARQRRLLEFRRSNQLANKPSSSNPENKTEKDITYDSLSELLKVETGTLSGVEFFSLLGKNVPLIEPEYAEIISICKALSDESVTCILNKAKLLALDWPFQDESLLMQPTERALAVLQRSFQRKKRMDAPEALTHAWMDQHGNTRIPVEEFPDTCVHLKISPHWMLRFQEDVPFYCRENPKIDVILDYYGFIPASRKPLFMMILQDYAAHTGDKTNGEN